MTGFIDLRHQLLKTASLLLAVSAIGGCLNSDTTVSSSGDGSSEGGTLTWARYGDVDSLDPHRTTTTLSWQVFDQIYDTLLAFDDDGNVQANLAKEWEISDDGLQVTFVLNEGITCHDGTEFDAQDVKYTADRALNADNPSVTKASWGKIREVQVVDPQTVTFNFEEPFGAFIPFMADPFASMICDSAAELGDAFGVSKAVGTGPFKLVSWTKGDQVVLEKNPDYKNYGRPIENQGAPYLDQLVVRQIPEPQTRLAGLETGELQLISEPPLEQIESIEANPNLENYVARKTGQNVFFEFTVSRPPFDDIRARKAVAYAVDPQAAIDIAFGDLVRREECTVARGVVGNDQELCDRLGYEHDPEQAKALLAELGYGPDNPLNVKLLYLGLAATGKKSFRCFKASLLKLALIPILKQWISVR